MDENLRDNLYAPWILAALCDRLGIHMTYIGTGCLFQYNKEHPIGGRPYAEEDTPNYAGNSYSVAKGYTDRMLTKGTNSVGEFLGENFVKRVPEASGGKLKSYVR